MSAKLFEGLDLKQALHARDLPGVQAADPGMRIGDLRQMIADAYLANDPRLPDDKQATHKQAIRPGNLPDAARQLAEALTQGLIGSGRKHVADFSQVRCAAVTASAHPRVLLAARAVLLAVLGGNIPEASDET